MTNMPHGMFIGCCDRRRNITFNMPWGMLLLVSHCGNWPNFRGQFRKLQSRKRKAARKQLFDLRLAPVRRYLDQLVDILWSEVGCEEADRCQMKATFG